MHSEFSYQFENGLIEVEDEQCGGSGRSVDVEVLAECNQEPGHPSGDTVCRGIASLVGARRLSPTPPHGEAP